MSDENDESKYYWLKKFLKVIGIVVAIVALLAVVAFGLLVGMCTNWGRG
jgi:hypothetical protein